MIEKIFSHCCAFLLVYLVIEVYMKKDYHSPAACRKTANRMVSMMHAIVTTFWCAYYLVKEEWSFTNTTNQIDVLQMSVGYFIADSIYMLIYHQSLPFLLHHVVALLVQGLILWSGVGGCYGLIGLGLGEMTNPLQITWLIVKDNKRWCEDFYRKLTKIYIYSFAFVRCVIVPPIVIWTLMDVSGQTVSSYFVATLGFCMISIVVASIFWTAQLWKKIE